MKSLIIGAGQIGQALHEIFREKHESYIRDVEPLPVEGVEILHIAFPYDKWFVPQVLHYIEQYKPRLTMIHSSVAPGTTDQCGPHVVHTPERGRHPNLAFEMKQFPKFIGGRDDEDLLIAASFFRAVNWSVNLVKDPVSTELLKLLSNVHLGVEVAWRQEVEKMLNKFGVESRVYSDWETTYNNGHMAMGQKQLVRPKMRPEPIGGHCILPCTQILSEVYPSFVFDWILETNERTKKEKHIESLSGGPPLQRRLEVI